jgi:ribose transport system substrate-binding protein
MNRSTHRRLGMALATTAVTLVTAVSASAAGPEIGESSPILSNPNQQAITRGEQLAAATFGWKVKTIDANLSSDKQVSDIDTLTNLGVKGMITWTLDAGAAGAAYKRAEGKGIPVVDYGSQLNVTSSVTDERGYKCSAGLKSAKYIAARVPKGKVFVIGGPPVPSITNFTNCFVSSAKKLGLTVVSKQANVKDTAATAQPIVSDMLTKHPDVNAIWAYNDPSALGAGAAVRSAGKDIWVEGKSKGIVITGANGSSDAAAGIKGGIITATWDPQPNMMGTIAVQVLAMHLKQGKAISALPKLIVIPVQVWDAKNIKTYVDPLKRKLKLAPIPAAWIAKK